MAKGKRKRSKTGRDNGRMKRKDYEAELRKLQVKLCHLQEWIKKKGLRVIIAFEGRDAEPLKTCVFSRLGLVHRRLVWNTAIQ